MLGSMGSQKLNPGPRSKTAAGILAGFIMVLGLSACASEDSKISAWESPSASAGSSGALETAKPGAESSSAPKPTGTLAPKAEFSCSGLDSALQLSGYSLRTDFSPEASSAEARAVASGGKTCKWQSADGSRWVTSSVEKISAQDYRDVAQYLAGISIAANFGTTNDSKEFFAQEGNIAVARVLNTTYLITVRSNGFTAKNEIGNLAHKTEQLLVG